jgi:hypothetical protein
MIRSGILGRRFLVPLALAAATACGAPGPSTSTPGTATLAATSTTGSEAPPNSATIRAASSTAKPAYAFYYTWWSAQHWPDKLGPAFPYTQSPLPLPATLDANGCNPASLYAGNHLVDTPPSIGAYDQDAPGVIETDVRNAAAAGLHGFIVNWIGTGDSAQTSTSVSYSRRLKALVNATQKVNAEGIPFKLWISYEASAVMRTDKYITGDLRYLAREYANDPAFDHSYSPRIMLIWQGSRKYAFSHIQAIATQFRDTFFLIADETYKTWLADARANYFDGGSWYWSSQDPYNNPTSFGQVKQLASEVRGGPANADGSSKLWFAPMAPGFNTILNGTGTSCVPRIGPQGQSTLRVLYNGNVSSQPDGWTLISWNEIAEGTFVVPLQRWGFRELTELSQLLT